MSASGKRALVGMMVTLLERLAASRTRTRSSRSKTRPPRACTIAVNETHRFLLADATMERVIFVSFDAATDALYREALGRGC